jgi:hypothetical protein
LPKRSPLRMIFLGKDRRFPLQATPACLREADFFIIIKAVV